METPFDFGKLLRNHEKKHKSKPLQFVSVAGGVQKRLQNNLKYRRSSRLTIFDSIRNLSKNASPVPLSEAQQKLEHRKQKLKKWKEEKQKMKNEATAQKKKPFISGVPHVPLRYVPPPPIRPSTTGRVTTRSQSARSSKQVQEKPVISQSFAPINATFKPPLLKNVPILPYLMLVPIKQKNKKPACTFDQIPINKVQNNTIHEGKQTRSKKTPNELPILVTKTSRKSPMKSKGEPKYLTPRNSVPKSESSSEEKLKSPKTLQMNEKQVSEETKRISPCVTMSRGKDNARREMKKKLEQVSLVKDTGEMENVEHFRRQLASEMERMSAMCDTWERISESVQESVLGAVGQARLLMSQKMQQFASLVERCAGPEPVPESDVARVTPTDLHGFWDMISMQVENVDMRFKELEELRARGWVEEQPVIIAKTVRTNKVPKKKPVGAASRIKEIIAAARKAKKDQLPAPVEKTFEAGFFCVKSPVRSPAPNTPQSRPSLLKAVLSSEAQKSASRAANMSASFAILRASVLGKNMECDGVAPLPLTPLPQINATPGRSILKPASNDTSSKSSSKCIKMVLFDQSNTDANHSDSETEQLENVPEAKEANVESVQSSVDVEEKENSTGKSHRLTCQDATDDRSPVMTRSRRKSYATPQKNTKAAQEKTKTPQEKTKTPQEKTETSQEKTRTPQEKTRTPQEKAKILQEKATSQEKLNNQEKTRRSTRKSKVLEELETNVMEELTPRPAPRQRRNVTAPELST